MPTTNLRIAVVHKGAYSASTAYVPLDEVSYQGSTYRNIQAATNKLPTDTGYWLLVASKGDDGSDGSPGNDGSSITNVSFNHATGMLHVTTD